MSCMKAIRKKCLDCSGGSSQEVDKCAFNGSDDRLCDVYIYRKGKNPALAGKWSGSRSMVKNNALEGHPSSKKGIVEAVQDHKSQ